MNNITIVDIPTILKQLYSSKNTEDGITRKLIENIMINNKYAATIQISERCYDERAYHGKSIRLYISHLYINRENRIVGRRNKIILSTVKARHRSCNFELLKRSDSPVYFFPDKHTLCVVATPSTCFISKTTGTPNASETACIEITFVGKNAKSYICNIKTMLSSKNGEDVQNYISIRRAIKNNHGEFDLASSLMKQKSMDDIIMHDYVRSTILNNLNKFTISSAIYSKYSIHRTIGFLLHGEPGTGKSSLVMAIIYELISKVKDYHDTRCENYIICTYMIDVAVTSSDLTNSIDKIYDSIEDTVRSNPHATMYAVVIMEEIDSVLFSSRENDLTDGAIKQKALLEFIDGIKTPNANCIFLATTNYYTNLDPALIRDGRFDVKVELSYFDQQQMTEMCEHFGVDKKAVFEYNNCPSSYYDDSYEICPATLQNMILSYKIEKELEETKDVDA